MKIPRPSFRTLTAEIPGDLLAAQVAASRTAEAVTATPETQAPGDAYVWELLGFLDRNRGAIDHNTPGLPALTRTEGDRP